MEPGVGFDKMRVSPPVVGLAVGDVVGLEDDAHGNTEGFLMGEDGRK